MAVSVLDQVLRPLIVGRHADLPPLLIFVGVVGGLVALGLLGVVVGPVVLAVAYTLLCGWLGDERDGVGRVGLEPTTKGL